MKKCGKCKLDKNDNDFSPSHFKKSGGWCRQCNTEYMRKFKSKNKKKLQEYQQKYDTQYYKDNKIKILHDKQDYYTENKDKILEDRKQYYLENKESKQTYNQDYYQNNKEKLISNAQSYYNKNINQVREYHNDYCKTRRLNDENFRIRSSISANISFYLKSNNSSKNGKSCLNYLEYTAEKLKIHLESLFESWMTCGNYGKYNSKIWDDNDRSTWTWQIDHIIPQSKLPYKSMEDDNFKKCWALDNLRPLSSKQNFLDSVNRIRHIK